LAAPFPQIPSPRDDFQEDPVFQQLELRVCKAIAIRFEATCATQTEQDMTANLLDEGAVDAEILCRNERVMHFVPLLLHFFVSRIFGRIAGGSFRGGKKKHT
jgi:hypothetical protein